MRLSLRRERRRRTPEKIAEEVRERSCFAERNNITRTLAYTYVDTVIITLRLGTFELVMNSTPAGQSAESRRRMGLPRRERIAMGRIEKLRGGRVVTAVFYGLVKLESERWTIEMHRGVRRCIALRLSGEAQFVAAEMTIERERGKKSQVRQNV